MTKTVTKTSRLIVAVVDEWTRNKRKSQICRRLVKADLSPINRGRP